MKVAIFGARGNLGRELVADFQDNGHEVTSFEHVDVDVTDAAGVRRVIEGRGFELVINAVAWNNVDGAEDPANRPTVWALNVDAPRHLAEAARDAGAAFVHYSTDYVFAGDKPEGYREDDEPAPISVYGESKAAGERAVRDVGGRWYVCRLSKIFGPGGTSEFSKPSFVSVMIGLAKIKPELGIVDEEVGCPSYTTDIAEATLSLIVDQRPAGFYHLVNAGPGVTWYGFAEEFFGILGVTTPRKPVSSALFPKPARRPKFAALLNTKLPPLRQRVEALKAFLAEHPDGY